jgi:hypothetical protein
MFLLRIFCNNCARTPILPMIPDPWIAYRIRGAKWSNIKFDVLVAVNNKIMVFWNMMPCSSVEWHWNFRGTYCFHLHNLKDKNRNVSTFLLHHTVTGQKRVILSLKKHETMSHITAMYISNHFLPLLKTLFGKFWLLRSLLTSLHILFLIILCKKSANEAHSRVALSISPFKDSLLLPKYRTQNSFIKITYHNLQ